MSKKKTAISIAAICAAATIVTTVSGAGFGGPGGGGRQGGGSGMEDEAAVQEITVAVGTPKQSDILVTGEFIGTVEPSQQVTVYPKAAGEVLYVNFSVGDTVTAGEVLFQIDASSLQKSISETQASLSTAQKKANHNVTIAQQELETYQYNTENEYNSSLLSAESSVNAAQNTLSNAELSLQTAGSNLQGARRDLRYCQDNRYDNYDTDEAYEQAKRGYQEAVTRAEIAYEQAKAAVEQAEQGVEQAQKNLEAAKIGTGDSLSTYENGIISAELNADMSDQYLSLQHLQQNLADYTVTSPISGIIEQRSVDPFDMVSTQSASFVISNKESHSVSFHVSEYSLSYMQVGDAVTIDKNGETCTGTISEISTVVDATGLYTVKASFQNPPFDVFNGSRVKVLATTQRAERTMIIPIDAVYYDSGNPYVYVYRDGLIHRTDIETGLSDETDIQVLSGLAYTDKVVTTWSSGLGDGVAVVLAGEDRSSSDQQTQPDDRDNTEPAISNEENLPSESGLDEDDAAEDETAPDASLPDDSEEYLPAAPSQSETAQQRMEEAPAPNEDADSPSQDSQREPETDSAADAAGMEEAQTASFFTGESLDEDTEGELRSFFGN